MDSIETLHETERDAVQLLAGYPGVVAEAARLMAPSVLVQYVYEVAKAYNRFYTEVPVFGEPDETKRRMRVALSAQTGRTIKAAMGLLGIAVPERM
jgi:arginyl-tRNA synthetase